MKISLKLSRLYISFPIPWPLTTSKACSISDIRSLSAVDTWCGPKLSIISLRLTVLQFTLITNRAQTSPDPSTPEQSVSVERQYKLALHYSTIQYWLKKFTVPNLPCSTSCFQISIKTIKLEWKIFKGLICNQERHKLTWWDGLARKASLRDNPFLPSQCLAVSRPFYKQCKTIKSVWKNIHSSGRA